MNLRIRDHIEELRRRLIESGMQNDQVSDASGRVLSASWVSKFRSGALDNPRASSVVALEEVLIQMDRSA